MRKRKVFTAKRRRKVDSEFEEETALAGFVPQKCGGKLDIRKRRDDESVVGMLFKRFG